MNTPKAAALRRPPPRGHEGALRGPWGARKLRAAVRFLGKRHQQGLSVVLMLALIVLLGGMLVYTVSVSSSMHAGAAREIGATRAAQAAQAGLEWGRFRIRMGAAANCAVLTNLNLPLASGAHPVTVRCTLTGAHTEGATTVRTYQLSATACRPAAAGACPNAATTSDYVEAVASGASER